MLSTLLSGAAYGTQSGNMVDGAVAGVDGQFFIAISVDAFTDPVTFGARVDAVRREVYESRRREGVGRLLMPGDIEAGYEERATRLGTVTLPAQTLADIAAAARQLGVEAPSFSELP
jgi:LDH2 family malate/lactate/ureidoglycolate dehydrogenase